jgi:hypothetical protein
MILCVLSVQQTGCKGLEDNKCSWNIWSSYGSHGEWTGCEGKKDFDGPYLKLLTVT